MARVTAALSLVMLALLAPSPAAAQEHLDEYQVKAAFLFNFAKFVQWPRPSEGPLVIGVIGSDPFGPVLDYIVRGKSIQGRNFIVRRFTSDDDLRGCHIVFVSASEAPRTLEILRRLANAPVLTVGETPHFLREGGIARFYVERSRVRFQIDGEAADRAGLRISAQLLSLSKE